MQINLNAHSDQSKELVTTVDTTRFGDVSLTVSNGGYPSITLFVSLVQFNQLRSAVNKFDVATVRVEE